MGLSRNLTRVLSFPLARALIPSPEWADLAGDFYLIDGDRDWLVDSVGDYLFAEGN